MASIPQKSLFTWKGVEALGDLERLSLVLRWVPDERLMQALELDRGQGRYDYPVRVVWNSLLVRRTPVLRRGTRKPLGRDFRVRRAALEGRLAQLVSVHLFQSQCHLHSTSPPCQGRRDHTQGGDIIAVA